MLTCQICQNSNDNKIHVAREMRFGIRDTFRYLECASCGCVQLVDVPANMSRYYPSDYYSFPEQGIKRLPYLRSILRRPKMDYFLHGRNIVGQLMAHGESVPVHFQQFRKAGLDFSSSILDVGCGNGDALKVYRRDGFTDLTGVDPFIVSEINEPGLKIWKLSIFELEGQFDFIRFQHSFEHMPNPASVLREVTRLLRPGACAIIAIPMASSYAWQYYGVDWVGLDAPRHLFLHTEQSIDLLIQTTELKIEGVVYDSWELQFTGSERYVRDIPLFDKAGNNLFTAAEIRKYQARADALNQQCYGDTATFFLRKPR